MGPINVEAASALNGDRVDSAASMDFAMTGIPNFGDVSWTLDLALNDVQAASFGKVMDALENMPATQDPTMMMMDLWP